jgi:hypothetical protein
VPTLSRIFAVLLFVTNLSANAESNKYLNYVDEIHWEKRSIDYWKLIYDKEQSLLWGVPNVNVDDYFPASSYKQGAKVKLDNFITIDKNLDLFYRNMKYKNLEELVLAGRNGWRLPTIKELKTNYPFKDQQKKMIVKGWNGSERAKFALGFDNKKQYLFYVDSRGSIDDASGHLSSDYNMLASLVLPVQKRYAFVFDPQLPVIDKLSKLTSLLTKEKLSVNRRVVEKPVFPKDGKAKKFVKGEFEKTTEFNDRVSGEKERVEELNRINQEQYSREILKYRHDVNLAQQEYEEDVLKNKKEPAIRKAANIAASEAMAMIFGDPKFKNLDYNADKELFDATLYSTLNSFSMSVKIPAPISQAKNIKANLLDETLIPSVNLLVENGKLVFNDVAVVTNEIKQEQEYNLALSKDTMLGYKLFLKYYPNSPYSPKAKAAIRKLEELARKKERQRQIVLKERAKKAAMEKQKERDAYMKIKHVGDKICKDGKVAFGLIGVTISAYVEKTNGDKINLRVNSTENQSIYYNGGNLYEGKLLWDDYYEWKHCD